MSTQTIHLNSNEEAFVRSSVNNGMYRSVEEVLHAALQALEEAHRSEASSMELVDHEVQKGLDSGVAEDGVFERTYEYIRKLAETHTK